MKLTDQFNATDPDFFKDIYDNDNDKALEDVRKIEERRVELKEKLEVHCQKHRAQWVTREAIRLNAKQTPQMNYELPKPRNSMAHQLLWNHHVLQARQIVDWRIDDRMQMLNTIARRMQHNVVAMSASQKHQDLARVRLDQEVKEIHKTFHRQRMNAYRDFENNKGARVAEACQNHSSTPERDVYERYKQLDMEILASKEQNLRQAYEKHGFGYEKERLEQVQLTQKYSHRM